MPRRIHFHTDVLLIDDFLFFFEILGLSGNVANGTYVFVLTAILNCIFEYWFPL